jgi:hypothetical protein
MQPSEPDNTDPAAIEPTAPQIFGVKSNAIRKAVALGMTREAAERALVHVAGGCRLPNTLQAKPVEPAQPAAVVEPAKAAKPVFMKSNKRAKPGPTLETEKRAFMKSSKPAKRAEPAPPREPETLTPEPSRRPSDDLVPIQFRMPADFVRRFKVAAAERDMKLNGLLSACFDVFMKTSKAG